MRNRSEPKSDYCRDCGRYAYYAKSSFGGRAFCGGYLDTIAKDAKTANHCSKRIGKYVSDVIVRR